MFGALGSAHAGERAAALAAIPKALEAAGLGWGDVAALLERGEVPGADGLARDELFFRLLRECASECLAGAWLLTTAEAGVVARISGALDAGAGVRDLQVVDLAEIVRLTDEVRRRSRPGAAVRERKFHGSAG